MIRTLSRWAFRLRMAMGRVAPRTIPNRRPAYFTADELAAACERRKASRPKRSAAASKGHETRRLEQMRRAGR